MEIEGVKAYAQGIVEHGIVEAIIDGILITFSVQEYSNGIFKVLLDDDKPKVRKILEKYGVEFEKNRDLILEGEFADNIEDIYHRTGKDNSAVWTVENYDELEYKLP